MARKDHFSTITSQVLDGGNSSTDSSVIGDVKVVIQRHVQIDPHEYPLPLQITLLQRSHAPLSRHFFANLHASEKGIRTRMRKHRKDSNFRWRNSQQRKRVLGESRCSVATGKEIDQVQGVRELSRKIYRERWVALVWTTRVRGLWPFFGISPVWGTFFAGWHGGRSGTRICGPEGKS